MKTLTEFSCFTIKNAIDAMAKLAQEGKTPEEIPPLVGQIFKAEGDKLKFLLGAIECVKARMEGLKRVIVLSAAEGEKIPANAEKREEHHYLAEFFPASQGSRRRGRFGDRDRGNDRGKGRGKGRGGRRDERRPGREGERRDPRAAGDRARPPGTPGDRTRTGAPGGAGPGGSPGSAAPGSTGGGAEADSRGRRRRRFRPRGPRPEGQAAGGARPGGGTRPNAGDSKSTAQPAATPQPATAPAIAAPTAPSQPDPAGTPTT